MREIKFRARWKDTGKPIPDFMDEYALLHLEDDQLIVEQYTGLKDKNGIEIFEGDINKWYTMNSANLASLSGSDQSIHYSVMTWIDEWKMWGWLMIDEYTDYLQNGVECLDEVLFWTYNAGSDDPVMICGNIHDNPELLQ